MLTKTNVLLIIFTFISICILTFFHNELPSPLDTYIFNKYYYYAIPVALVVALIFLNFFAITFGKESRVRKEALDKIVAKKYQKMIAEHGLPGLPGGV